MRCDMATRAYTISGPILYRLHADEKYVVLRGNSNVNLFDRNTMDLEKKKYYEKHQGLYRSYKYIRIERNIFFLWKEIHKKGAFN